MLLGLSAALLAAVLFGVLAVGQARVIRRRGLFSRAMLVVLAGYLLGWMLHLVAIAQLPLYLAQVGVSASLIVTALVAAFVIGEPLTPWRWGAVFAMVLALALLTLASGRVGDADFTTRTTTVIYVLLVLNALLGWAALRWRSPWSGVALAVLSGTAYGGTPVATRALVEPSLDVSTLVSAMSVGLYGALGFLLYSAALRRTTVTSATAPLVLLQTLIPAVVGIVVFGDRVRTGWWPLALVAFAVSLVAAILLCGAESALDALDSEA